MLEAGQPFPDFELPDQDGNQRTLHDFKGERVLIYFYPKDDTSGCTTEACEFQESIPRFDSIPVVGVSPDSVKSHRKFADKYGLTLTLLSDGDKELSVAVGVWVEKSMYGKKYMGVERTSFLVSTDGMVEKVWNKVKPAGHAEEVLKSL